MSEVPTSKVTQAVRILRNEIAKGQWPEFLPGERKLASQLMISRACLRKALEILTQDGVLAPVEQSKRRSILKRPKKKKSSSAIKVVFFTPEPAHKAAPLTLEQIALLRHHLSLAQINVEVVSSAVFKHSQTSDSTMTQLTSEYPGAHWVLHQCPEHLQNWFSNQPIRATVLGSLFAGVNLPYIDIDLRSASRHATGQLLAKGHRHIGLVRFRSHLAGDDHAIAGINEALLAHGSSDLPQPTVMSHNFHVERVTTALDTLFTSASPPTALIVVNHHHFLTVFSHLLARGIRIPEQVSIISLCHDPALERLSPLPVCYSTGDQLIKNLVKMIINPLSGKSSKKPLLIPDIRPGNTVGPCRSGQ